MINTLTIKTEVIKKKMDETKSLITTLGSTIIDLKAKVDKVE